MNFWLRQKLKHKEINSQKRDKIRLKKMENIYLFILGFFGGAVCALAVVIAFYFLILAENKRLNKKHKIDY